MYTVDKKVFPTLQAAVHHVQAEEHAALLLATKVARWNAQLEVPSPRMAQVSKQLRQMAEGYAVMAQALIERSE